MSVVHSLEITRGEVTARRHAQITREALRRAAIHHINSTIAKKFKNVPENQPGGEYGYNPSPQYLAMKRRRGWGDTPNMRQGAVNRQGRQPLHRYIRAASLATVRATQHRATLFLKAPFPMRPNQRRWLERMSNADRQIAQATAFAHYATEVAKPGNRTMRRRRIA